MDTHRLVHSELGAIHCGHRSVEWRVESNDLERIAKLESDEMRYTHCMRWPVFFASVIAAIGCSASDNTPVPVYEAGPHTTCEPDQLYECECPDGTTGTKKCFASGTTWHPCSCSTGWSDAGDSAYDQQSCATDDDCANLDTPCVTFSCVSKVCVPTFAPEGTPVADQQKGDCKTRVCDGQGQTKTLLDLTDLPEQASTECGKPSCTENGPKWLESIGKYCTSTCTTPPCGISDPAASNDIADWGVCTEKGCQPFSPVRCATSNRVYEGCSPFAEPGYVIHFGSGNSKQRICDGKSDRGYCTPADSCLVIDETLGLVSGVCQ